MEDGLDLGECAECGFLFCPKCMHKTHGETPCLTAASAVQDLTAELDRGKLDYATWVRETKKLHDEEKSEKLVEETSKVP